jgi:HAD superfamily hydrolase (TIGR01509 family)
MPIRGLIFDLDGTLVDSGLDFNLMRREMGLADGLPLLETIERLSDQEAARCWQILERHELEGARRATLYPGVRDFLDQIDRRGIARAIFTRNCRSLTAMTLDRLEVAFDQVVCREDGPVKPHPKAIWQICANWGIAPGHCLVVGDHRFDILAGRSAGCQTVLYIGSGQASGLEPGESAHFTLASFSDTAALWRWVDQIDLGGVARS